MNAEQLARRNFLKGSAAILVGVAAPILVTTHLLAQDKPAPEGDAKPETSTPAIAGKGKAKHLIMISLVGGPPHTETFDPKPKASKEYQSRLATIDTKVDDIKFTSPFKKLAEQAADLLVVNSITSTEGNHDRARYLTHTSHAPTPTVKHPGLGSILAKELGKDSFELPHFIAIGNTVDGGYLGAKYNPLLITDASAGVANIAYRKGDSSERMARRLKLRSDIDKEFKQTRNQDVAEAQEAMYEKAKRMMDSKKVEAFDISKEKKEALDAYGRTNFGNAGIMARRLVEAGVTAVEVSLGGWDLHDTLVERGTPIMEQVDTVVSQLIKDLKASGKFEETIITCYGEFGRTPIFNERDGRDHFPRAWSMLLAGGPLARGKKLGATDDKGDTITDTPISVPDFMHTMSHCFGFDPLRKFEVNDRPIWYFDKAGSVRKEFFA